MARPTKWELKMREQRELRKQGAALLFRRVVLCNECYESNDFRSWCEQNSTNDIDFLDNELSDSAASFLTLRAVLKAFPDESEWTERNIRELIAEVLASQKRESSLARTSWKEKALAFEKENVQLKAEVEALKASVKNLTEAMASVGRRELLEV